MQQIDVTQFLPYGSTGLMMVLLVIGSRFAAAAIREGLDAFKVEAKAQREAWQSSSKEQRDAWRDMLAMMQLTKDAILTELKTTRHDLRNDMQAATAVPGEQLAMQVKHLEQLILLQFRELRDDLAIARQKQEPSRIG